MDINNKHLLYKIVKNVLKDTISNSNQWNFNQFIETDAWKPNKNNIHIQNFIK